MDRGPRPQKLARIEARSIECWSKPRQRIDARAQFVGERLTVPDRGYRGEGDRRADHDWEAGADASLNFVEDERQAQRQAEMTGDLEKTAVLAAEPDRNHRPANIG